MELLMLTPFTISTFVVSLLVSLVLLWIIARKSAPEIGVYRYLLFMFVMFDITYATFHFTVYPAIGTMNNVFFMITTSIGTKWSILLFSVMHQNILVLLLIHFVYRYILLERPQYLVIFRSCLGVSLLTLGFAAEMILWGSVEYFFYFAYPDTTDRALAPFTRKFPYLTTDECLVVDYWSADDEFRWFPFFGTIFFTTAYTFVHCASSDDVRSSYNRNHSPSHSNSARYRPFLLLQWSHNLSSHRCTSNPLRYYGISDHVSHDARSIETSVSARLVSSSVDIQFQLSNDLYQNVEGKEVGSSISFFSFRHTLIMRSFIVLAILAICIEAKWASSEEKDLKFDKLIRWKNEKTKKSEHGWDKKNEMQFNNEVEGSGIDVTLSPKKIKVKKTKHRKIKKRNSSENNDGRIVSRLIILHGLLSLISLVHSQCSGGIPSAEVKGFLDAHNKLRQSIPSGTSVDKGRKMPAVKTPNLVGLWKKDHYHQSMFRPGTVILKRVLRQLQVSFTGQGKAASEDWESEFQEFGWSDIKLTDAVFCTGIGHAQMAWAKSTKMGCGMATCQNGKQVIVACQYRDAGNILDQNVYDPK